MQLRKQNGPPQGPVRYWMKDAAGSSSGRLGLVASGLAVVAALEHRRRHQASILADLLFDLRGDLRVLLEDGLGVLAALADALAVVGEPGAGLFDDVGLHAEVQQLAGLGDALSVGDRTAVV